MEKPITVLADEFQQNLIIVTKQAKLPAFIMRPILTDVLKGVIQLEQEERRRDQKKWRDYQASLRKAAKEKQDEDTDREERTVQGDGADVQPDGNSGESGGGEVRAEEAPVEA